MDWLTKVLEGKSARGLVPAADVARIRQDIDRLDGLQPGLASETLRYIVSGENDSVLLTLQHHKLKLLHTLRSGQFGGWSSAGGWCAGRSSYILVPEAWRPAVLRRYAQVLAIGRAGQPWPKLPGTERSPAWFRTLLHEYGESWEALKHKNQTPIQGKPDIAEAPPFTVAKLADMLAEEGEDRLPILDAAFEQPDSRGASYFRRAGPQEMPDFEAFLRADPAARAADIARLSPLARATGLRALARLGLADGPWFDLAFEQASDSSKTAREAAVVLLRAADPAQLLRRVAASYGEMKKSAQRIEIGRAVAAVCGDDGARLLRQLIEHEKNESAAAELRRLVGSDAAGAVPPSARTDGPEGYTAMDGGWIETPPKLPLPADIPVSPALRALFEAGFAAWRAADERYNREQRGQKYFHERVPFEHDAAERLCGLLNPGGETLAKDRRPASLLQSWHQDKEIAAILSRIAAHPDLTLWHLLRAAKHMGHKQIELCAFGSHPMARAMRPRVQSIGGLAAFAACLAALGEPQDALMRLLLQWSYWSPSLEDWPPEQTWPYFTQHFQLLDEALGLAAPSRSEKLSETQALELLKLFPQTPARYFPALIELSIGERITVKDPARELLAQAKGVEAILLPLLSHPKQDMRIGAANWLAERQAVSALDEIIAAAKKEKLPSAKAALIGAIARLGGDITAFVSSAALVAEAKEGLKKISGKELAWLPFEALPAAVLADGSRLDPVVVRWWLALAAKLKQPGGSPWFDLLLDQLAPAIAAALGSAVLQAWVAFDTSRPSEAEANAHAQANVQATLASWKRWQPDATHDSIFAMLRRQKLGEYFNSGNDSKGILALAVRAPGSEAVAIVKAFFRDHYPRTAQCKALLECLAGNPSPVATQYVLAIARRWRTRTVQETASELVQQIAARRGWTAEELADRTIPTAGFDESGVLELPVGERAYTARLDERNQFVLFNPDGKPVQNLPAAPAGEKDSPLTEAKATLAAAREEAKQVFEFQAKRLYEALCVERRWPRAEWSECLLRHPLAGRLVQRLLWAGLDEAGNVAALFRPMEDLSLTGVADEPVDPANFAAIRLAHRTLLDAQQTAAWQAHFKDYGIAPLFDQLGRAPRMPSEEQRGQEQITDRRGWMVQAFKLRAAATRLGYNRGAAEDGGVFMTYEKFFEALHLVAVVEFTGNNLPEEDRLTALTGLSFRRMGRRAGPVPLKDVPGVLLSEVWNDFHDIAAAGTGFDAAWETKGGW